MPTPNFRDRKSLDLKGSPREVENVEVEDVETVETVESIDEATAKRRAADQAYCFA
jgi:hypothetical protein